MKSVALRVFVRWYRLLYFSERFWLTFIVDISKHLKYGRAVNYSYYRYWI